ncbi:hypothetical protein THMIRHAS_11000 [Thiosulfatimonas sediminis]|uniref:Uncharacterized protein n=1 Tax=Thiosulfatimonas sediminis TaxID=2675054 RepID=A0A6F8PUM2_9GAMM|nr:hypothetical protein [Thiosulfatimonas sediminis]BBP45727.1 hypothetical protein THMIRHAS_11000 [Thiosulfatimonas sediminis]
MNQPKAKFTWHYYVMAFGALLAMLAGTLGAIGGIVSGLAIAVLSHPRIQFQGIGRFVFYVLFLIIYVFAFPDPQVVREMMTHAN